MIRKALIFVAAAMAVLCVGCQATPDKPIVVQKNLAQMIEKGTSGSAKPETSQGPVSYAGLCAHYGVPERFQKTVTEGNLTINCDVAVELPETYKLPMARVEAGRFSQEQVYALFGALCADTPMYLLPEVQDKAYYEQKIIDCQARLAKGTDEDTVKFLKTMLQGFQTQYEKAPEAIDMIPADGTMESREYEINENGVLSGTTMMFSPRRIRTIMINQRISMFKMIRIIPKQKRLHGLMRREILKSWYPEAGLGWNTIGAGTIRRA